MTIKEIAEKAGVSSMTVSNVINGKNKKVSKSTTEKVKRIIEENHYTPNLAARSLASPSSKIIAIFVPLTDKQKDSNLFLNPYLSEMIGVFEECFREKGYFSMIRSIDGIDAICSFINNWNLDGAIIVYPYFKNQVENLRNKTDIPVVYMDFLHTDLDILTVNIKDQKGTYISTKYLIEQGHKKIAFIGNFTDNHFVKSRFDGYRKALEEAEIEFDEDLVYKVLPDYNNGIIVGKTIANKKLATAIVTTSDFSASGIMEGIRSEGYSIPEDFSVIGYDNTIFSSLCYPKLTTVDQHINKKASAAAALLIDRISGTNKLDQHLLLDVDLIIRGSTGTPRN